MTTAEAELVAARRVEMSFIVDLLSESEFDICSVVMFA